MAEQHVWVAREHWIEYLRPALLGDHLSVYTWLQETAGPICLRRYAVVRGRTVLTRAATEWAHIDFKTKRAVMPPDNQMCIRDRPQHRADEETRHRDNEQRVVPEEHHLLHDNRETLQARWELPDHLP